MPTNCVELIVYDNDGPEGFYKREFFKRSHQALEKAVTYIPWSEFNFKILNHYKIPIHPCANQVEDKEMG